jgi:hypothetical protein
MCNLLDILKKMIRRFVPAELDEIFLKARRPIFWLKLKYDWGYQFLQKEALKLTQPTFRANSLAWET